MALSVSKDFAEAIPAVVSNAAFGASWQNSKKLATRGALFAKIATLGTVTSVGLSLPAIFAVSGSPVTGSGTLTASLANQTANNIFAGPTSGGASAPAFRALVAADIPALDAAKITSGQFAAARIAASVGANQVVYLDGSSVPTSSNRFKFDGTDLSLINPTAATVGAPSVVSPYFILSGAKWNGSESRDAKIRLFTVPQAPSSVYSTGFGVDFFRPFDNSWQTGFRYISKSDDFLFTQLELRNPAESSFGGIIRIGSSGTFNFLNLSGAVAPIGAGALGANPEAFPTLSFLQNTPYGISLHAYFGAAICFASGYPGTGVNASGSEFVQSNLPISIGVGASGSAMLQVRRTTEQLRLEYSATQYVKTEVSSAGVVTSTIVGTSPKFIFANLVSARLEKRINTDTTRSSLTPDISRYEVETLTAQDQSLAINNPSGTPTDAQELIIRITANGLGGDSISFDTAYLGTSAFGLPSATPSGGITAIMEFHYYDGGWILINYQEV